MRKDLISGTLDGEQLTVKQITIRTARKLFDEGVKIYAQPALMNPFNSWYPMVQWDPMLYTFDDALFNSTWNRCNPQSGKYLRFYLKVKP